MPLTIKELHVRMVVEENKNNNLQSNHVHNTKISEDRLIQKCIEEVLQILDDRNEM